MAVRSALAAATLLLGVVYAQEDDDDHGDSRLTSTRVEHYGVSELGQLGSIDDVDVFRLDLQGRAEIEMRSSGALDIQGTLYDSEGNVLAEDDDGGTDLNFRIVETLDGGVYYVEVASNVETGDYKMTARIRRAGDDHGDTSGASTLLPLDIRTTARIAPADDVDVFRIEVPEEMDLVVASGGPTDTVAELRDSTDAVLVNGDSGGDRGNFRIQRRVDPGIYYVSVTAKDVGSFTLLADLHEPDGTDSDDDDSADDGGMDHEPMASAEAVFGDKISTPIVQGKCANCHVAGGAYVNAGGDNLIFVRSTVSDHEAYNFNVFKEFVGADDGDEDDYAQLILDKIRGMRGHGGLVQIADGSEQYMDMEEFLSLLVAELVDGDDDEEDDG